MLLGPVNPLRGGFRMRCQVPVEIVTADRGKEDKQHQPPRRIPGQQQVSGLVYHHHGTQRDVQTAEQEKVEESL